MKHKVYNILYLAALAVAAMMTIVSCKDEVELPRAFITVDTSSINAPAAAATFKVNVEANCDWSVDIDDSASQWISVSGGDMVGNGSITINMKQNTTDESRSFTLVAHNHSNSAIANIELKQNSALSGGVTSIGTLRKMMDNENFAGEAGLKIRGIVVSDQRNANFKPGMIAIADGTDPDCGIAVKTRATVYVSPGEEVEVNLEGASASYIDGMKVIVPADDAMIAKTECTPITPTPVKISLSDACDGKYESMYVTVAGQIIASDLRKESLAESVTLMDELNKTIGLYVSGNSLLGEAQVPTGSGYVNGLIVYNDGIASLAPCAPNDIALSAARFDGGIMFPYVFSLMTEGSNNNGRYVDFVSDSSDANKTYIESKDGTGARLNVSLNAKSKTFYYWNENSGHHNLQLASWLDGNGNYMLLTFPLCEDITDGFRISFGLGGQKNAPANWEILYSTDNKTWMSTGARISIPKGVTFGGGKGYLYFSADIHVKTPIARKETLYVKLRPADKVSISGGSLSDGYGRAVLHSCVVLDRIESRSTAKPAGAIYFEAFDLLTQGLDYRLGDRLSAMLNYCGDAIDKWDDGQLNGLSGVNVYQRPGYAQIGYVDTQSTSQKAYVNKSGSLITPELGVSGNVKVTFKAMAYRNTGVFSAGANTAKDFNGDADHATIEIVDGGTINGVPKAAISSLSYSSFKKYTYEIENVTPSTRLKFSSTDDSEFTRWFIDEICVTK